MGTVNIVLIPARETPFTSYVCTLAPSTCGSAVVLRTPLVKVSWPVPKTYETTSSSINAVPLSVDIPWNDAKGAVLASETVVLSAVNAFVEGTIVVSGLTFTISTLLVAPWWAWLYCVTSNTLPANKSPFCVESPFTATLVATVLVVLLAP